MSLLEHYKGPEDLKNYSHEQLIQLCDEVRQEITRVTLNNGGHLASSLGAVEIVVALLKVFDFPKDKVVFDVGHQSYAWKILTDRRKEFSTLRQEGGLAGFPKREESPYDAFGTGHSSTALSATLGFAVNSWRQGGERKNIAVVGDGALINGHSFEALNHAGWLGVPLICVLNDNGISISPRVGGMARHLATLSTSRMYQGAKSRIKRLLNHVPGGEKLHQWLSGSKDRVKRLLTAGNLFTELGWTYIGPCDGHDLTSLIDLFESVREVQGPVLLHLMTCKGKGHPDAEAEPVKYHGMSPSVTAQRQKPLSWSQAVSDVVFRWAAEDEQVLALTPAMEVGSCLTPFATSYPDRYFDGGIAEGHMMTFGAALAADGAKPVLFIYSSFMQRAMDQLAHDLSLQNLPLTIAIDRAGLVGDDGSTHHGLYDIAWSKILPNVSFWCPADKKSLELLPQLRQQIAGPLLFRFPRGAIPQDLLGQNRSEKGFTVMQPEGDVALIALGSSIEQALGLEKEVALACLEWAQPLPLEEILRFCQSRKKVVILEEGAVEGGVGQSIALYLSQKLPDVKVVPLGVGRTIVHHASQARQRQLCGIDLEGLRSHVKN